MDKLYVIKIGGNVIDDANALSSFLQSFSRIESKKILVHGGGKLATRMAGQLGIPQAVVEGRRITDAETLKVVTMVYAGHINKNIVAGLQSHQCNAVGLTGADGNIITANKREKATVDYGFAGDIEKVNAGFLETLLDQSCVPVIASITHDGCGQLLNTNADTIANGVAKEMSRRYNVSLVYCFENEGVLRDVNDPLSVIRHIDKAEYSKLKTDGVISGGMIPKIDNAMQAIEHGVQTVIIGKAQQLPQLIETSAGTTIQ